MDNCNDNFSDDNNDCAFNPQQLPATIPLFRPPIGIPLRRRFALPHWHLILVAAFASVAGALTTALWSWAHHNKSDAVATASLTGNGFGRDNLIHDNLIHDNLIHDNLVHENEVSKAVNGAAQTPTTKLIARSIAEIVSDSCQANNPAPQLVSSGPPTLLHADEPASLGLAVEDAPDGTQLVICGFAAKSAFSAGQSIDEKTWTVSVSEIADATLVPPQGFVGTMKLAVVLVNSDRSLDRKTLNLQWLPQAPAMPSTPPMPRKNDSADVDRQLERGIRLKSAGNMAEARLIFGRIAQNGDSRAAFMLAETYDPIALAKRQLLPPDSDLEQARIWYRKASDLGSQEARGRLERLTNW
jgi:hypothetical protein